MFLYNRVNKKELKQKIRQSTEPRITVSFYKYAPINDPENFRDKLFFTWNYLGVLGRVYVAREGINAQISIPQNNFTDFKNILDKIDFLRGVRLNKAIDDDSKSFFKLTIKVRDKIVADGLEDLNFDPSNTGTYLNAEDFNALIENPDTLVVDMRNHYESEVGHFENAITPDVDTFRESLQIVEEILEGQKDKPVLMYCTGGIRCEKASAYYKHRGFKNVYQLDGGIIEYARQVRQKGIKCKFIGKNFVFDERLGERITDDVISVCHQCGKPCDTHANCRNDACHLLFIQCDECAAKYKGCCSEECKEIIHLPEEIQAGLRKGKNKGRQVYKKGRSEKLLYKA